MKKKTHSTVTTLAIPEDVTQELEEYIQRKQINQWPDWKNEVLKKYAGKVSCKKLGEVLHASTTTVTYRVKLLVDSGLLEKPARPNSKKP